MWVWLRFFFWGRSFVSFVLMCVCVDRSKCPFNMRAYIMHRMQFACGAVHRFVPDATRTVSMIKLVNCICVNACNCNVWMELTKFPGNSPNGKLNSQCYIEAKRLTNCMHRPSRIWLFIFSIWPYFLCELNIWVMPSKWCGPIIRFNFFWNIQMLHVQSLGAYELDLLLNGKMSYVFWFISGEFVKCLKYCPQISRLRVHPAHIYH